MSDKQLETTNFIDLDESDLEEDEVIDALMYAEKDREKSMLDKATMNAMISYVKNGAYVTHAANAVGISTSRFYKWMKWGEEEPDSIYGVFYEEMKKAFGAAAVKNELLIQAAAPDDWKAAAWWLAKMFPAIYGKDVVKMEVSGPDGIPIQMEDKSKKNATPMISDEEIKRMYGYMEIVEQVNKLPPAEDVTTTTDETDTDATTDVPLIIVDDGKE